MRIRERLIVTLIFWVWSLMLSAQNIGVVTWNIQDLGRSKGPEELEQMAEILRDYDLVAIQEVVGKDPAGAKAVATLADLLDRKGADWDYRVSNPTRSPSSHISERYAFLWKTSRLRMKSPPYLDQELEDYCYREPFVGEFIIRKTGKLFFLVNFHARRFDDEPEKEIRYFIQYPERADSHPVLIAGDFNLDEGHEVWEPFYQDGFDSAVRKTPTTLKRDCNNQGEYFNYPIDNIFFQTGQVTRHDAGRIDFVGDCANLSDARGISDHLPVFLVFSLVP